MCIEITLPFLTPGLNGPDGLIRQHFAGAGKMKTKLAWLIRAQWKGPAIRTPVRVTYIRHTARLMDWDNAAASFKHIGDALQVAGVLSDDSPAVIAEFLPRQIKCKIVEQRTQILIEKI